VEENVPGFTSTSKNGADEGGVAFDDSAGAADKSFGGNIEVDVEVDVDGDVGGDVDEDENVDEDIASSWQIGGEYDKGCCVEGQTGYKLHKWPASHCCDGDCGFGRA
jgi:cytoskeletal protein CcmA (bactofilin family)